MELKKCNGCGNEFPATKEYFYWHKGSNYLIKKCKECTRTQAKYYRQNNIDKIQKNAKQWSEKNLDKVHSYHKKYNEKHKEKIKERSRTYNRQRYHTSKASLTLYAHKLTIEEDPKDDGNGHILARCTYCGKYFRPTTLEVKNRIHCLTTMAGGENRLYCSDGCKAACPIFRRWSPEAIDKISGENSYNWRGGITTKPYCPIWIKSGFKENIRKRDNHQCQNPHCRKNSKRICVHHIDYIKKNCHPLNLITICNSCNSRANFNREYWQEFYTKVMTKKFKKDGLTNRRHKIIKKA